MGRRGGRDVRHEAVGPPGRASASASAWLSGCRDAARAWGCAGAKPSGRVGTSHVVAEDKLVHMDEENNGVGNG